MESDLRSLNEQKLIEQQGSSVLKKRKPMYDYSLSWTGILF